jgi:hypothetical protein
MRLTLGLYCKKRYVFLGYGLRSKLVSLLAQASVFVHAKRH